MKLKDIVVVSMLAAGGALIGSAIRWPQYFESFQPKDKPVPACVCNHD